MTGADMKKNTEHSRKNNVVMSKCLLVAGMMFLLVASVPLHAADLNPVAKGAAMDASVNPNIGRKFPVVEAKTLAGQETTVPDDAAGKVTLVCVAFLRESQSQLDSWLNPFYEKFGSRDDIMFYEVPMISGGYKFMKPIIDGGMRGGLPQFKHKHVVTMYGDVQSYQQALNIDPRNGHAFLLDREGTIRWQEEGFSNEKNRVSLFAATEALLQQQ
jgi:ATP10 protein